jgi:hypothetical protein
VWPEAHAEIEIPGRPTVTPAAAATGQPDALAVPDLGRELDVEASAVVDCDPSPAAGQRLLERRLE